MSDRGLAGFPWWLLLVLVALGAAALALALLPLMRRRRHARELAAAEQLAEVADAEHEGAITRHEGGA